MFGERESESGGKGVQNEGGGCGRVHDWLVGAKSTESGGKHRKKYGKVA